MWDSRLYDNFASIMVSKLARRNVGQVARNDLFKITFRIRYWALHVRSSSKQSAPLRWDGGWMTRLPQIRAKSFGVFLASL